MAEVGIDIEKFETVEGDNRIYGHVMLLERSCWIWASTGSEGLCPLGSLTASMPTRFDDIPLSTLLIDSDVCDDTVSAGLSARMAKRFNIQCMCSGKIEGPLIEILPVLEKQVFAILDKRYGSGSGSGGDK